MMKRIGAGLLAAVLAIELCSCSRTASETTQAVVLPEPADEGVNMILGERIAAEPASVELYYVSGDGTSFSTITRSMIVSPGENLQEEAVDALLYNTNVMDRMAFIPDETKLLNVEYSCGIATVSLSLDAHSVRSEQEMLMLVASVANTLLGLDGVRGVNVLIADRAEALASLPLGVLTELITGVSPAYAKMNTEREYFLEAGTDTIVRSAALYFPDMNGMWLVPELRELNFDSSDYASELIRALRSGPMEGSNTVTALPEGADLLVNNPVTEVTASGERVLQLEFSPTLLNYLAFAGIEEWKMIASVVLTVTSFVPEIDAVRMLVGGEIISECTRGIEEVIFEDGLIRRRDFADCVGNIIRLCVPNGDGTLDTIERAVPMERAQSPLSVLKFLFDEAVVRSAGGFLFPGTVDSNDLLGVSVESGVASVNLSANFYRQAQALDATAERGVIYAIVNTLCRLDGITGVRFYIEGISAETLSGSIYLKGVLLPNPGLHAEHATAVPEITATP